MTMVLWVNCFTGQLIGGYWMHTQSKKKDGPTLTRVQVLGALLADPDAAVEILSV